MLKLKGIIPAMPSPLNEAGRIDEESTCNLVEHVIGLGVDGLFILGTMGEGGTLLDEDKLKLAKNVVAQAKGRIPVLAGAMDTSIERTIRLSNKLQECGVDAIVLMQPFFFRGLEQSELKRYFDALISKINMPLVIYNNPGITGNPLTIETLKALLKSEKVIAVKDSTSKLDYLIETIMLKDEVNKFSIFEGDEWSTVAALLAGADGIVTGIGSIAGRMLLELYSMCKEKEVKEACERQQEIIKLMWGIYGKDRRRWLCGNKEALVYMDIINCAKATVEQGITQYDREDIRKTVDKYRHML